MLCSARFPFGARRQRMDRCLGGTGISCDRTECGQQFLPPWQVRCDQSKGTMCGLPAARKFAHCSFARLQQVDSLESFEPPFRYCSTFSERVGLFDTYMPCTALDCFLGTLGRSGEGLRSVGADSSYGTPAALRPSRAGDRSEGEQELARALRSVLNPPPKRQKLAPESWNLQASAGGRGHDLPVWPMIYESDHLLLVRK